jgi:transposase
VRALAASQLEKLAAGLTAQRIYQDLISEHGFAGRYHSVRRFVRRLDGAQPLPFRRLECTAGEEAQVDFGRGIPITGPDGRNRRTHVFGVVLSHSRTGYSAVVYRQSIDEFLHCLENAFAYFGGVTKTLVLGRQAWCDSVRKRSSLRPSAPRIEPARSRPRH